VSENKATPSTSAKLLYRPVGLGAGILTGLVAKALFGVVWKKVTHEDDSPSATDEQRDLAEILAAAALEGIVYAVVKAAIDRGGAKLFARLTGEWPG